MKMTNLIAEMTFDGFSIRLIKDHSKKYALSYFTYIHFPKTPKNDTTTQNEMDSRDYFNSLPPAMLNFCQRCGPFISEVANIETQNRRVQETEGI